MCKVRCWRWLFGNKIPISLQVTVYDEELRKFVQAKILEVQGDIVTIHFSGYDASYDPP